MHRKLPQKVYTKRVFFILASLWAILGPLAFIISNCCSTWFNLSPNEHGSGMLFGFTSALITGYLGGKRPTKEVIWLVILWSVTRLFELIADQPLINSFLYAIYGVHTAVIVVPRFWKAKSVRNWLMSPSLGMLLLFPIIFLLLKNNHTNRETIMIIFGQLLTLVMFFMSGRMIAPLQAKANVKNNHGTKHRVQPYVEGIVMGLIILSLLIRTSGIGSTNHIYTYLLSSNHFTTAFMILVRVWRWQPFNISLQDAPFLSLIVGYIWLAVAQLAVAFDVLQHQSDISSLHLITLGALGIFSSTIMTLLVSKHRKTSNIIYLAYAFLISGAAITRYAASLLPDLYLPLLSGSIIFWTVNYFLVFLVIIKTNRFRSI